MPKFNRLFIAEKSSVGKALAEYLAKTTGKPLVMQSAFAQVGDDFITWMSGHLLEQVPAHAYDPKFEKWNLADLPIIPSPFRLTPRTDMRTKTQAPAKAKIDLIKKMLADCTSIVGCGDADAEGQLLQDELLHYLGNKKPVTRLLPIALDDSSMAKQLAGVKPNADYIGWYEAALSRSESDWLYGINMTRACTLHARSAGADFVVNIGRVQTPTLALVVNRELEIRNFNAVDFHVPFIDLASDPGFRATWHVPKNAEGVFEDPRVDLEGRLLNKADADAISSSARAAGRATVVEADTKAGTESAPLPFSLSSLQAHCSRLFSFTAKQTLDIAQALYLKKVATYPRVDCDYLPESQHADAPRILSSLSKAQLPTAFATALLGAKPVLKSKAWNDSKVTAHHAIVPTHLDNPADIGRLEPNELKVYLEIAKRYILQFWPVAKFNATEVLLSCGTGDLVELYAARGRRYLDDGWRKAFAAVKDDEDDEAPSALPTMTKGQVITLAGAGVDSKRTQPPKRFTEGSLITAMKNIYLYVKDPEYRRRLQAKEGGGIGTEATRGPMIETMKVRGHLFLKGKEIHPSDEALRFISLLPESMKTPDMTAMWGLLNDDVMARKSTHAAFIAKMVPWVTNMVGSSAKFFSAGQFPSSGKPAKARIAETQFTCFGSVGKPGCGSPLKHIPEKKGAYRSFFGCSNEACKKGFSDVDGKPVERAEQAGDPRYACQQCRKGFFRRVERKDKSGFFWGCSNWKEGCKAIHNDLDGAPDLEGKTARSGGGSGGAAQPASDPKYKCTTCNEGSLGRRERNDKSGFFWSCSAWRSHGCKAIFNDFEGEPDLEGKGRGGSSWRNGAPVAAKPGPKRTSGFRGGRAVTPQMTAPAPK
jgi:DNA topoisomerase-3